MELSGICPLFEYLSLSGYKSVQQWVKDAGGHEIEVREG